MSRFSSPTCRPSMTGFVKLKNCRRTSTPSPGTMACPNRRSFFDGKPVKTPADWKTRRDEILQLYQKHVWGAVPPHPKFDHADVQETPAQGYRTRTVVLHVGPDGKGTLHVTLQIPQGTGPFPVVMGPGLLGGFAPLPPPPSAATATSSPMTPPTTATMIHSTSPGSIPTPTAAPCPAAAGPQPAWSITS